MAVDNRLSVITWTLCQPLADIIRAGGEARLAGAGYTELAAWSKTTALAGLNGETGMRPRRPFDLPRGCHIYDTRIHIRR
jgi:hypothetical protein